MQTNTSTELRFTDAEPYLRIEANRYETYFSATERTDSGSNTVKVLLPKSARSTMMNTLINELSNLRYSDCDDRALAIEWLSDAQSRINRALQELQPEAKPEAAA